MTTCRFTLPGALCARLANLHLATHQERTSPILTHISLTIRGEAIRFAATDGRILAVIRAKAEQREGAESLNLLLDASQFTDAVKIQAKVKPISVTMQIDTDAREVRLSSARATNIISLRDGDFPRFEGLLNRYAGGTWVPSIASYSPVYTSLLSRLTGETNVLLNSIAVGDASPHALWEVSAEPADDGTGVTSVPIAPLRSLMQGPGWWSDHEMLVLVMPIARPANGSMVDFSPFLIPAMPDSPQAIEADAHAVAA